MMIVFFSEMMLCIFYLTSQKKQYTSSFDLKELPGIINQVLNDSNLIRTEFKSISFRC